MNDNVNINIKVKEENKKKCSRYEKNCINLDLMSSVRFL